MKQRLRRPVAVPAVSEPPIRTSRAPRVSLRRVPVVPPANQAPTPRRPKLAAPFARESLHPASRPEPRLPVIAPLVFQPTSREGSAPGGRPLEARVRAFFEPRFGADFSGVRIHADARADVIARAAGASACAVGEQVIFAEGRYAPESDDGRRLLAHELAHVVQQRRGAVAHSASPIPISEPGDPAEREAHAAANLVAGGAHVELRESSPPRIARQPAPGGQTPPLAGRFPPPPAAPPVFNVFEVPSAATVAGAPTAFDAYLALAAADQERARSWSFSTGALGKALAALGSRASDPKYDPTVRAILRWIEETATRATTGKTDAEMAKTQAGFITAAPSVTSGGWGGTTTTRWAGLLAPAKASWTARGNKAIADLVAHAATRAPELKLTAASFELDFDGVDRIALGALATGGSIAGKTVQVGFEFVVATETNPAYALSTVVHELLGHPVYDDPAGKPNYAGALYSEAAKQVAPGLAVDPTGNETFNYWPSEIYSLLKELPYFTAVSAADAKKSLAIPGDTTTAAAVNYDPRGAIERLLKKIQTRWEPSLVNGIVRGLYQRVLNDPSIQKMAVTALQTIIRSIFSTAAAAIILK